MSKPAISVILPVHNGSGFLKSAVQSILNQSFGDFELLIFDDGSNDGTSELVQDFERGDQRIRAIYRRRNQGIVSALNALIDMAEGEYIARMDADDIAMPKRLESQLETFPKDQEQVVSFAACELINKDEEYLGVYTPPTRDFHFHMRFRNPFVHPLLFTRTRSIRSYGYREVSCAEDYDLYFRMMTDGFNFHVSREPLLQYRRYSNNLADPEKAFLQMTSSLWIQRQIRTKQPNAHLDDLESYRNRFDFQLFARKWPAYASRMGSYKNPERPWPAILLNYGSYDALIKATLRNSLRYTAAKFFR